MKKIPQFTRRIICHFIKEQTKISIILLLILFGSNKLIAQNVNVNPGAGSYPDLTSAFNAINAGTHTGAITVAIVGNTTETTSAVLNASGIGSASYTSIVISPSGGSARTISGAVVGHLIDLSGADNVTIDGLNSGGNSLTISNTSIGATSTIRFIDDANNNTIQKCTILGSTTSFGVIYFATGTTTGNDGNNINNCDITSAGTNLPLNGIYSLGTSAGVDNSNNTLDANNISDFFSATSISVGVNVNSFNSAWTISNNKLFQTALRTYTSANTHSGINVNSGEGYTITGNTIGYATSTATGVYTMTSTVAARFIGIALAVGAITSSVQGNTITAINLTTSSGASTTNGVICGINITSGNVNIGNISGNTIGAASGTGAIVATPTTTGGAIVGINSSSTGTILIQGNTIGAFTSAGATAAVAGAISGINISGAATSVSVINNTIGNSTPDNMRGGTLGFTTGGTCNVTGINNTSTSMIAFNATGNTIQNLSSFTSGTSGFVRGIVFGTGTGLVSTGSVSNNTITNLKATSALTGYTSGSTTIAGILLGTGNGMIVSGNTISNLAGLSALTTNIVVSGINLAGAQNTIVSENRIFGLSNAGTGTTATSPPVIAGIIIRSAGTGFPITIRNNMISLGNGQTTNTSIIGIMSNHGSTPDPSVDRIYFNSINIEGTVTSGALSTACFNRGDLNVTARSVAVDIKNNIFNNTRSGGSGSHYAIGNNINSTATSTGWGANASNYNLLNANASTIGFWTSALTFSAWQSTSLSDVNSLSGAAVNFVNTAIGDLHITLPYPSIIEGVGINIPSVTIDYDGQTRAALSPEDLGADAGNFILSPSIAFTPLTNSCTTGSRTLSCTISDPDGVPTSGVGLPVLYWKINAGAYTAATANYISGNQYDFTFGSGVVIGDVVSYYIAAQDNLANVGTSPLFGASGFTSNPPAASTPPTISFSYAVLPTMSGTYTVGVGGNYTTLTAAVAAYNNSCLGGPVTFSLTDATYPSETFPIIISSNPQASATNTLTIKPTVSTTISGSSATSILNIDGGDFITIDGSIGSTSNSVCPLSSATRDLTISNTNAVTTAGVIWLGTNASGNSVTNCAVMNCILSGASSTSTIVGLGAGGPAIGSGGTNNDNISFVNNDIRACQFGIYSSGASALNKNQNLTINQNFINNASPNNVGIGGIYSAFTNNITISGNTVGNISNTLSSDVNGINVGFGATGGFSVTTTGIADATSNVTISNNTIGIISQSGTFSAVGIALGNTISGTSLISNNTIYGVSANGTSGDYGGGILLGGGSGQVNVYYNTVSMQGTISGATAASQASTCLAITASTPPLVDLRNNIFTNTQLGNAGSTNRFMAIGLGYSSTLGNYANLVSDNNNLYASGAGPGTYMIASTGGIPAGIARNTLIDWQTETGRDLVSKNVLPEFISSTDLHLQTTPLGTNWCLNSAGINLPSVTNDFDCVLRSNPSDLGAYEFNPLGDAVSTPSSQSSCTGSPITTIVLTGTATSFNWTRDNTVAATGIAASGTGDILGTLTNTTASPVVVTFTITPVNASGCFGSSITATVTVNPIPTVTASSSPSPATVCAGTSITLTGAGATTYTWTDGVTTPTDGVAFIPTASSTYTVTGSVGSCSSTATIAVTVISGTAPTTIGDTICGPGIVNLTASGAPSDTLFWYTTPSGGSSVAQGTSFNPTVTSDVTYYVEGNAVLGSSITSYFTGLLDNTGGGAQQSSTNFNIFDVLAPSITLDSVTIYPGTTGPQTVNIQLANSSFAVLQTIPVAINPTVAGDPLRIPVGMVIPAGTGYQLGQSPSSILLFRNSSGVTYPYTVPGVISITSSAAGTGFYYFFYNWRVSTGSTTYCPSATRTPVLAKVNPLPIVSATPTPSSICPGGSSSLLATGADTYTWMPGSLSGTSISVTPSATTVYTVTGTETATGCSSTNIATVTMEANPIFSSASATPSLLCANDLTSLTANATVMAGGTGPGAYTLTSIAHNPEVPTGPTNPGPTGDDIVSGAISLPFPFTFYGIVKNNIYISTNGFVSFDPTVASGCCTGQSIPDVNAPNDLIAFAWEDLNIGAGQIDYFTNGVAPNRKFVVRFTNAAWFGGGNTVLNGQIILNENDQSIEIHGTSGGPDATNNTTAGIENSTGTLATAVPGKNSTSPWTWANEGWRFSQQVITPISNYAWSDPIAGVIASPTSQTTNANPTSSYTYTVTATSAIGCTATSTVQVNVNPLPAVNASPATQTVCENASATVAGGGATSYVWSGGITDATPFIVTSGPTTYTVTGTDGNGCSNTATAVVNMNAAPAVTAGATPTTTCNNTVVTPSGGGASTYTWSGGLTDNTPFVATVTATYTVTGTDGVGCSATSSVTVTVTPASGILAPATSNQSQVHNDDFNVNYSDASCNLIATVDDGAGGNILGLTTATVNVETTAGAHNGQPFVRRWYQITPTSNGSADVILYINQADFNDYNASVIAPYLPLPTSGNNTDPNIGNIRITKNSDAGLGNSPVVIIPSVNWNGTYWELSFNTTGFSQFRVHSVNPGNVPLPVTVTNFSGRKMSTSDLLEWTTASEQNNAYFNLQHGTDGINFTTIAKVNSQAPNGNSSSVLNYSFENTNPQLGHNYYRLEQVDIDNQSTMNAKVVDIIWGTNGSTVSIYPNPTQDVINIDLYTTKVQNTTVKVLDMSGRIVKQIQGRCEAGMNKLSISLSEISSGVYTVQVFDNDKLSHVSKVKKN
jgi:hypothetical protein